jgi:hypothetical protein
MAAVCSSFAAAAANGRHSAVFAVRGSLFGRALQVSRNRRGKDLTCIYTEERPDLARELPNWMFDETYCAGMSLGPAQVGVEALNELVGDWRGEANLGSPVHDRVLPNRGRRFVPRLRLREGTWTEDNSRWCSS